MSNRIEWIDTAKSIGIFLVVLGHQGFCNNNIPTIIYSFHMPLFFFLSGIFFKSDTSWSNLLKRKSSSILMPYFLFAPVLYLFWFFLGRHYGNDATMNYSPLLNFIGVFYGQNSEMMQWGMPMWFLLCLFIVNLLYKLIGDIRIPNMIMLITFFIIGVVFSEVNIYRLPWSIDVAFIAVLFFGLGHLCRDYLFSSKIAKGYNICVVLIGMPLLYYGSLYNGRVDMFGFEFKNVSLFILNSVVGIVTVLAFSKMLPSVKFLNYIGRGSLIILVFHQMVGSLISGVRLFVFHDSLGSLSLTKAMIVSVVQIVLLIPIIYIWDKYLNPMLIKKISHYL